MGRYSQPKKEKQQSKHPRFCRKCRKQTFAWSCCGQRTSSVNMTSTIGDKIQFGENKIE